MEYEEYLAKANSGAFQAASPGPPSGKTIAGKRGENITTLLPSSAFQRAMAEQTMVALLWQQGDARGTLNLPASTKVEDLKLRLNASDCDAVMFDAVIIEVRKAGSVLKRKLDTQKQDAVVDPSWTLILSKPPAEEPPPEPLTEVRVYTHQRAAVLDHVPLRPDFTVSEVAIKLKEQFPGVHAAPTTDHPTLPSSQSCVPALKMRDPH